MFRFGFRIKLLLSMLAVVGLCTAVMLRVSLRRVEAAPDHLGEPYLARRLRREARRRWLRSVAARVSLRAAS